MFDKGEKGQTRQGGVRVLAIAYWPGMIEPGQDPLDIVHTADLYATFLSIADAVDKFRITGLSMAWIRRRCSCSAKATVGATMYFSAKV